jgi:DNA repair photolyase
MEEYMDYLVFENNSRLYVNTSLGCTGGCSYCYLPKIGLSNKIVNDKHLSAKEVMEKVEKEFNIKDDILISFGCFSECWDKGNKETTKNLIKYFLDKGNQVQMSTKREVKLNDMKNIEKHIKYFGQLVIFISSASISEWQKYEANTEAPDLRFQGFNITTKYRIPTVLYLKPVLRNITIKDINLYKDLIEKYNIRDVVVAGMIEEDGTDRKAEFIKNKDMYFAKYEDMDKIMGLLKPICEVFTGSSMVMKKYRDSQGS